MWCVPPLVRHTLYLHPNIPSVPRSQLWCWWSCWVSLVLNQVPPPGMLVNNKYCPMLSQHCPDLIALLEIVSIVTMHVINIVMRNFNCYRNLYLWDTLFKWLSYVTFLWLYYFLVANCLIYAFKTVSIQLFPSCH